MSPKCHRQLLAWDGRVRAKSRASSFRGSTIILVLPHAQYHAERRLSRFAALNLFHLRDQPIYATFFRRMRATFQLK